MADEHLGTDMAFNNGLGLVTLPTGDIDLVTGRACLAQDILNRLSTPRGSLWCHPEYGLDIYPYLHSEDTDINRMDLAQAVEMEVEQDPRVEPGSASCEVVSWDLNKIVLRVTFMPVEDANPINLVLGYGLDEITGEIVNGL